jgi:hypothetical protein
MIGDLLTVRAVIRGHFELRQRLGSSVGITRDTLPGSGAFTGSIASMIQAAKDGLFGRCNRGAAPAASPFERALDLYCDSVQFLTDLSPLEYAVLLLRFCGSDGWKIFRHLVPSYELHPLAVPFGQDVAEARERPACNARLGSGALCRRARGPEAPRCWQHEGVVSAPATRVTRGGDEFEELTAAGSWVVGKRARAPSPAQIGEALGLTPRRVATLLGTAYAKVGAALERGSDQTFACTKIGSIVPRS